MNFNLNNCLFLVILFTISSCNQIYSFEELDLPIIENAATLGGESNMFQKSLYLLVQKKFPNYESMNYYTEYFSAQGWIICKNQNSDDWYSYIDMSGTKDVRKFQKINFIANFDRNVLGTIFLIYISDDLQNENFPNNDNQYLHLKLEHSFDIRNDFSNVCNQ